MTEAETEVDWSAERGCFVGSLSGCSDECCSGATEEEVLAKLAVIQAEFEESLQSAGLEAKPIPKLPVLDPGELFQRMADVLEEVEGDDASQSAECEAPDPNARSSYTFQWAEVETVWEYDFPFELEFLPEPAPLRNWARDLPGRTQAEVEALVCEFAASLQGPCFRAFRDLLEKSAPTCVLRHRDECWLKLSDDGEAPSRALLLPLNPLPPLADFPFGQHPEFGEFCEKLAGFRHSCPSCGFFSAPTVSVAQRGYDPVFGAGFWDWPGSVEFFVDGCGNSCFYAPDGRVGLRSHGKEVTPLGLTFPDFFKGYVAEVLVARRAELDWIWSLLEH